VAYLLVRHTVADYAKWKPVFDEHAAARKAAGCRGGILFRRAGKPNEITILFEWDNLEKAQQSAQSDTLRQAMEQAGVMGIPEVSFLDKIEDLKA